MSIKNFSETLFVQPMLGSTNPVHLGSFTNDSTPRQISNIRVVMYFDGSFTGERVKLTATDSVGSPTFSWDSDIILCKNLDPTFETGAKWLGWVTFDFSKQWIYASTEYHLLMSATGYTETLDHSINMIFDYPAPWNGTRQDSYADHPIAFQVFGYERI